MYSRYPGSIFLDNHSFPIFLATSNRLDNITSRLFHTGILQIGRYQREMNIAEMRSEKERSEQFQILSMQWFDRVLNSRNHREGQIVFGRYWDDVIYPIILEIHKAKSEPFFMAWNDHAYALRTMMLSKLYLMGDKKMQSNVGPLLADAVSFLTQNKNYDPLSNHGWDQAKALLIASKLTGKNTDLAINRFRNELTNAFSSEGIHVENSPHYHVHMMNNLITSIELFLEMEIEGSFVDEMTRIAESTVLYYNVIVRENGTIPCIGDSHQNPPKFNNITKKLVKQKTGIDTSDGFYPFPETGYCYWRDDWDGLSVHLSLKNSHLSRYHRHDDDLSLTLNIGGIDVFIDGGLYKYEEKDEHRIYLRSPFSHSTIVLPEHNPQRKLGYEINNSSEVESKEFTATSGMWEGHVVSRTIKMVRSNQFNIQDSIEGESRGFKILFQTTCENITIEGQNVIMDFENFSVHIDFSLTDSENIETDIRKSIYSPQYDQLVKSTTVAFTSQTNQLSYRIIFVTKEVNQ